MEEFTYKLAKKISSSLQHNKDQEAVLAYGLIAMVQVVSILITILCIGIIGGFAIEAVIIFLGVGYLRKSTGGAHSDTMRGCYFISCISILLLALCSKFIMFPLLSTEIYLCLCLISHVICILIIYKKAPVESEKKPITSIDKRIRLRNQSLLIVFVYILITVCCVLLSSNFFNLRSIAASICLLTMWQTFTLTSVGSYLLHKLDNILN